MFSAFLHSWYMQKKFSKRLVVLLKADLIMCDSHNYYWSHNTYSNPYQIELGFLMVGHTHEDIDQFFSKFSQYL